MIKKKKNKMQKAFIDRMFIDPFTGEYTPISPDEPVDVPVDTIGGGGGTGGGTGGGAHSPGEWFIPLESHLGPQTALLITLSLVGIDGVSTPLLLDLDD